MVRARIETLLDRATRLSYGLAAVALVGVLALMTLRIVSRNLGLELAGLQLYAQALAVWLVFVTAGALEYESRHIEIDYFTDRLPDWLAPYHDVAVGVVNLVMCGLLLGGSGLAVREFWAGTSPSVNIPLPLYYVPVLLGVGLLALVYLYRVGEDVGQLWGAD